MSKDESASHYSRISSRNLFIFAIITFITLSMCGVFSIEASAAQKFYPNGRYGKRLLNPPLMPSENSDDAMSFIGNNGAQNKLMKVPGVTSFDRPLTCYYTGFSNFFRCLMDSGTETVERTNGEIRK